MRVNWLTYTSERNFDRVESTLWIRAYQLFPYLAEQGIECLLNASPDAAPLAVVLRWQDDRALEAARAVKRCGGKVVFDLCVNYFNPSGLIRGRYGSTEQQKREAEAMARVADAVTCASEEIAVAVRRVHGRVTTLPDSIDFRHFARVKPEGDFARRRLRAAWSGVHAKAHEVWPLLAPLAGRRVTLMLITDRNPFPPGSWRWLVAKALVGYEFVPWHYGTFPDAIVRGDFCVSPRDISIPYNLGHSLFKIGVFLAEGVPALASPVPSYREVLGDGQAGRICADPGEWRAALQAVVRDRALLVSWSRHGRAVMERYSSATVAAAAAQLFRDLGQ